MVYKILGINEIKTTDKLSIISLSVQNTETQDIEIKQFFTDDEQNDTEMSRWHNANTMSLQNLNNDEFQNIFHNLFESSTAFYKSALYTVPTSKQTGTTYDFKNIFQHTENNSLNSYFIQVDGVIYGTSPESHYGRLTLNIDSYSYLSIDNGNITLPNNLIYTYTYNRNVISALINGLSSRDDLSTNQEIQNTFISVDYTPFCEIPGYIYNDYQSGNIGINTYKCKNQYNSIYNMSHSNMYSLKNCRSYIRIDNCNKQIYLVYYDNINYTIESQTDVNTYKLRKEVQSTGLNNYKIQHIELVQKCSRYTSSNSHHTNLYSLQLNTNIFTNVKEEIKSKFKSELKKAIKIIANEVQPIHAQLYDIIISET